MPFEQLAHYLKLAEFGLICCRLAGMIMFQPILTSLAVPMNIRALLVIGLSALITPLATMDASPPDTPLGLTLALSSELLLGILLGMATTALFLGLQFAGMLVAQESGLAYGQILDPTLDEEETSISSFYLQLGAVVFFTVGGHRAIIGTFLDTFHRIPLLSPRLAGPPDVQAIVEALSLSGEIAVRIAIPTLLTLFLVNVALGFVSRTLPQLHVTTVGFSIKTVLAFVLMASALPGMLNAFTDGLSRVTGWMQRITL